ncbi:hypothetical protein COV05_03280 [Candidatus Uhrbacteria bacterium CG10_big_fil_rev_8_21_14_0_10_48_16]|uniref:CBU-0592-like domain-containing protein n=1 Tax=Candidatus Uhrbacteria bacterium CG10_big_fil_rev_8_21_14_0_10_48_16 TaxID=1975038 RepID=A0A2M8LGY0_9BACT|nr:MAG: hypothetical protein COV05_03280 [Candidatus Uhrbacteria bacterium CG10_big_fil_rev_8_21_14_0_10_48_16]
MKPQTERLTEFVGWAGVLCILLAYGLLSFEVVESSSVAYHSLNLLGGAGIIVDAVADKNYQPAVLNVAWIGIALFSIIKISS